MSELIKKQSTEIEKQLTNKGVDFSFIGSSDTNGISIYYRIKGMKCRFSDHSVTNTSRVREECHFNLPFVNTIGFKNGEAVTRKVYKDNALNFKLYLGI